MEIYPAIDLKDNKAVRLVKGDFAQMTVFNDDPVSQASQFFLGKLTHLHVVDLDGALEARAVHAPTIKAIKKEVPEMFIEVGGGIRTLEQISDYVEAGINRVIIGSAALTNPELVREAVAIYGDKIAVGIDAKDGKVAISGWLDKSETDYVEFALEMEKIGVSTIIYTDISRDGTLTGPNIEHYEALLKALTTTKIIASGGVSSLKDLEELAEIGAHGAIVGKAYYNGNISLEELANVG
ncbi:MAG: 1-(5-phosphoribosyl)-5-[(5-phosphoribosylamino)methylideneamino]imidazole-4-carboxamide isomerase [Lactobacillales bacterium]|jgi:phosphoribosylformimino-5-aminoimidazole carboxamide ribotide isomerase|nr:1-(5-phosphoribosyl)-5-[(5-phosphoribosylamino)methylideneamino]imidazole-4-carboxamide isomerase [Lactobacillales bacterium]